MNGTVNLLSESFYVRRTENDYSSTTKEKASDDGHAFRAKLLQKLERNEIVGISDQERQYICHHLTFFSSDEVPEFYSLQSTLSNKQLGNKRKRLELNKDLERDEISVRNNTPIEVSSGSFAHVIGKSRKARPLTQILNEYIMIHYDYEVIRKYLRDSYYLPSEKKDQTTFDACFKILFENRRAYIMSCCPPVQVVKHFHPYLFNKRQVFTEFGLLAQREDMYEEYVKKAEKRTTTLLNYTAPCPSIEMISNEVKNAKTKDDEEWIKKAGSLLLLPKFMNEELHSVLLCDNEEYTESRNFPHIRCYGDIKCCVKRKCKFKVFIDRINLCETSNILEAFFGLMAAYHIFNEDYPSMCLGTLGALETLYTKFSVNPVDLPRPYEERIAFLKKRSHSTKL